MKLYFRTKRNASGHCKFLGIDTDAKQYAIAPQSWICKEYPVIDVAGYKHILFMLKTSNYEQIENM